MYGEVVFFLMISPTRQLPLLKPTLLMFYRPFDNLELLEGFFQTGHLQESTYQVVDISAMIDLVIAFPAADRWFITSKIPLPPMGEDLEDDLEEEWQDDDAE